MINIIILLIEKKVIILLLVVNHYLILKLSGKRPFQYFSDFYKLLSMISISSSESSYNL